MAEGMLSKSFSYLQGLLSGTFQNFIMAVIILLIGFIIGRVFGKIIERFLKMIEFDRHLRKVSSIKLSISELIGSLIAFFIYIITILLALNQLQLTKQAAAIIATIIIIIIILAFVVGIKDFIPNSISGFLIRSRKYMNQGDNVKLKEIEGKIIHIGLLETLIETPTKEIIYIPNSVITKAEMIKIKKGKQKIE